MGAYSAPRKWLLPAGRLRPLAARWEAERYRPIAQPETHLSENWIAFRRVAILGDFKNGYRLKGAPGAATAPHEVSDTPDERELPLLDGFEFPKRQKGFSLDAGRLQVIGIHLFRRQH